jgi:sterol desaturase/sphingolipid hydroxylase (fatty acid hydroxylase superfamily)
VLTKNIESSGMKSGNLLVNLSALVFILVIVLVFFFFFWLASKYFPLKYRDKIKEKFDATIKKTFWNGIIRSITISYLLTAIAVGAQITELMIAEPEQRDPYAICMVVVLSLLLVGYLFLVTGYLWFHVYMKDDMQVQERTQTICTNLEIRQ